MGPPKRPNSKPRRADGRPSRPEATSAVAKPTVTYGPTLVILEDPDGSTFEYKGGSWIPFGRSIAECRRDGVVKQLPQKVNKRTRFEVRLPK